MHPADESGQDASNVANISDDDGASMNSKSNPRADRVERGASLMEELRVMLDEEGLDSSKPNGQDASSSDPTSSTNHFRFERGPSLLYEIQREMQRQHSDTSAEKTDAASNPDVGDQATADKRRAFAFRPGMHIVPAGEETDGGTGRGGIKVLAFPPM